MVLVPLPSTPRSPPSPPAARPFPPTHWPTGSSASHLPCTLYDHKSGAATAARRCPNCYRLDSFIFKDFLHQCSGCAWVLQTVLINQPPPPHRPNTTHFARRIYTATPRSIGEEPPTPPPAVPAVPPPPPPALKAHAHALQRPVSEPARALPSPANSAMAMMMMMHDAATLFPPRASTASTAVRRPFRRNLPAATPATMGRNQKPTPASLAKAKSNALTAFRRTKVTGLRTVYPPDPRPPLRRELPAENRVRLERIASARHEAQREVERESRDIHERLRALGVDVGIPLVSKGLRVPDDASEERARAKLPSHATYIRAAQAQQAMEVAEILRAMKAAGPPRPPSSKKTRTQRLYGGRLAAEEDGSDDDDDEEEDGDGDDGDGSEVGEAATRATTAPLVPWAAAPPPANGAGRRGTTTQRLVRSLGQRGQDDEESSADEEDEESEEEEEGGESDSDEED